MKYKQTKTYYSHGKLLLTGEYLILDGAEGLALPTRYGQYLTVYPRDTDTISWESVDCNGEVWFQTVFKLKDIKCLSPDYQSVDSVSNRLYRWLCAAKSLNSLFLIGGCHVTARLDFDRNWGLGSSSTLVNNIAQWAVVDAYSLLWTVLKGSGYDIACAQNEKPILYSLSNRNKPMVRAVDFTPSFVDQLFFIYLNKKQQTQDAIDIHFRMNRDKTKMIKKINELTKSISTCESLLDFERWIAAHEHLMSDWLSQRTIKKKYFSDYGRAIKSLGAWGGDFILVVGTASEMDYFRQKAYQTIIPYQEMIRGKS